MRQVHQELRTYFWPFFFFWPAKDPNMEKEKKLHENLIQNHLIQTKSTKLGSFEAICKGSTGVDFETGQYQNTFHLLSADNSTYSCDRNPSIWYPLFCNPSNINPWYYHIIAMILIELWLLSVARSQKKFHSLSSPHQYKGFTEHLKNLFHLCFFVRAPWSMDVG